MTQRTPETMAQNDPRAAFNWKTGQPSVFVKAEPSTPQGHYYERNRQKVAERNAKKAGKK